MNAIYPGSFDPVTYGHIDIIKRAAKQAENLTVSILYNPSKDSLFSLEEKKYLLEESIKDLDNVKVDCFQGLLSDYVKQTGCTTLIRGLRAVTDFEYELQMAHVNKKLNKDIETLFMVASNKHSYLSSSIVREIAMFGGDVSCFVPDIVENSLKEKFEEAYDGSSKINR